MRIPLNFTGGSYKHKSPPLTNQHCRNFWPQAQGTQKAESPYILQSFYGLKLFKEFEMGYCRGMLESKNYIYRVVGNKLYKVDSNGTHIDLGTIDGSDRCILKPLGDQIIVVNDVGQIYVWDGTALTLNTDPDIGQPNGVAVLNNQAIYDAGSGQEWSVSDVGMPLVVNGLNYANAESSPDDLVLPVAYRETLNLFGVQTTEQWWNSGNGNPPFEKIQGSLINVGLKAIHSVAETPDLQFFYGSDDQVHSMTGGTASIDQVVSTPALAKIFQSYEIKSDAIGWTMQLEGTWFYVLTFPTQNVTWVYPVGGEWFEWGTGKIGRIRANAYVKAFNKHLVSDYASGNLYELDAETYLDVEDLVIRTRDCAPLHGGLFGEPGKAFELTCIELRLQTGTGNIVDPGANPMIAISVSKNGGRVFGTERFVPVGRLGDDTRKIILKNFGRFEDSCVIRLRVSDPNYWAIYDGVAEVEPCI